MSEPRIIPTFASETEEANWWYRNREKHDREFVQALDEGRVELGGLSRRLTQARGLVLDLDSEDMLKARSIAESQGMDLPRVLAQLIHEALETRGKQAA